MKKETFLYVGSMQDLVNEAKNYIWICKVADETQARKLEKKYHVSAKQYVNEGLQMKLLSEQKPDIDCIPVSATLEDAYIYITNKQQYPAGKYVLKRQKQSVPRVNTDAASAADCQYTATDGNPAVFLSGRKNQELYQNIPYYGQ